jgi:Domain of unknown function (DUF222)
MDAATIPASAGDALDVVESLLAGLAAEDNVAGLPGEVVAERLRALERIDAIAAAVRGRHLEVFDAQDGHLADGQRTTRSWLVHTTRITRRQAAEHQEAQLLARSHPVLHAALAEGWVLSKSEALQVARWTRQIPKEYRTKAEEIVVTAARAGADLRDLARICGEIREQTARPDPGPGPGPGPGNSQDGEDEEDRDRAVWVGTTFEGAGVIRGDLTSDCASMVQAVLDALAAPQGGGDLRTRPQRYHDALEEAMRRLLASNLLPQRAGQPVKALVHIHFAELLDRDGDGVLQDRWITGYRARWAAHRAAASVSTGDGGAWLDGEKARKIACDAMLIPVVTGDVDPGAVDELILLCVQYHRIRTQASASDGTPDPAEIPDPAGSAGSARSGDIPAGLAGSAARDARQAAAVTEMLAGLEHQIIAKVLQVVSGPGGAASFLRRQLLGKPLGGPSLPLDVGQTDDVPVHLRRLVALRDQTCQFPGGCDQPASGCEAHHVVHRADGGRTSLTNLKDYCWWHHHVVLHQMGWVLTAHADGTSQVRSPAGKTIRSHSPPPRPTWRPGGPP